MPERVKVNKGELLKTLEKNLILHKDIYATSLDGYKRQFILLCETILKGAIEKDKFDFASLSKLVKPDDHSDDYSEAIKMISMHVDDTIILEYDEFRNYILNKWDWINRFRLSWTSNRAFSSSSAASSSSSKSSAKEYFGDYGEEEINI
jgi:hypothetical protein